MLHYTSFLHQTRRRPLQSVTIYGNNALAAVGEGEREKEREDEEMATPGLAYPRFLGPTVHMMDELI